MGFGAVLIVGIPDYYPKLGFERASHYGLTFAGSSITDAFMAYELVPGYLRGGGVFQFHYLAPEYGQSDKDDAGYRRFHRRFMAEHFPDPKGV